jgi:hypothetical protein
VVGGRRIGNKNQRQNHQSVLSGSAGTRFCALMELDFPLFYTTMPQFLGRV